MITILVYLIRNHSCFSSIQPSTYTDCSENESYSNFRTIRRQLEGLESMYSEVLKALQKKNRPVGGGGGGGATGAASGADFKMLSRRRLYGSVSSLPSSVCSRPVYRDRRRHDDRKRSKENKVTRPTSLPTEPNII